MRKQALKFDRIGYWSEVKLDIVREYAAAYSTIMAAQRAPQLHHVYVDAFAGGGYSISRTTGGFVLGSPLNALNVKPPFREHHFIDLDRAKADSLRELTEHRPDVTVYEGDCNAILLETILPRCRWADYRRALWLLDPYGLHLHWPVLHAAGQARSIELFLNFPVMDMNRNVLWSDQSRVGRSDRDRMSAFWGDDSWRQAAYTSNKTLFGDEEEEKAENIAVAHAFCDHLKRDGGFEYVAEPLPMRNSARAVVYYLVFASQKPVAKKIVRDIFDKYRRGGAI